MVASGSLLVPGQSTNPTADLVAWTSDRPLPSTAGANSASTTLGQKKPASYQNTKDHETPDQQTPWLDAIREGDTVYFLYLSPARIESFDMQAETWLPSIPLGEDPKVFTLANDTIYVGYERTATQIPLAAGEEFHLQNTTEPINGIFTYNGFVYISNGRYLTSVDPATSTLVDFQSINYRLRGFDVAPSLGKAFARSSGVSPSDIFEISLNEDGTLAGTEDSPYHSDFPGAEKTVVFPGEQVVGDNSGTVYNTTGLGYVNHLGGPFEQIDFHGSDVILLRDGRFHRYSDAFFETGRYAPAQAPLTFFIFGEDLFFFSQQDDGIWAHKLALDVLQAPQPGDPLDPNGLTYEPTAMVQDSQGDYLSVEFSIPQHFPLVHGRRPLFGDHSPGG